MTQRQMNFFDDLPETLTVFRGQGASQQVGLSWTLDRNVAERYAELEFNTNSDPVVLEAHVHKSEIAIVGVEFQESEVVLFNSKAVAMRRVHLEGVMYFWEAAV